MTPTRTTAKRGAAGARLTAASVLALLALAVPARSQIVDNSYVVEVTTAEELASLQLGATDQASQTYLSIMTQEMNEGLAPGPERSRYGLFFEQQPAVDPQVPQIFNQAQDRLTHVLRSTDPDVTTRKPRIRKMPFCAVMHDVGEEVVDPDNNLGGDAIEHFLRGVCGPIAALHSAVRLGKIAAATAYVPGTDPSTGASGTFIDPGLVRGAKRFQGSRAGMTRAELAALHRALGMRKCVSVPKSFGVLISTSSVTRLSRYNEKLKDLFDKGFDCTIFPQSTTDSDLKKWDFAHYEHVTGVSLTPVQVGGKRVYKAVVTTKDGLQQGNMSTTVPAAAGTNTWTFEPKADDTAGGQARMTAATNPDTDKARKTLPDITHLSLLCCK